MWHHTLSMTVEMGIGSQWENKSTFNSSTKVSCSTIITQKQWQLCRILLGAPFLSTMSRRSSRKVEIFMTYTIAIDFLFKCRNIMLQLYSIEKLWSMQKLMLCTKRMNKCTSVTLKIETRSNVESCSNSGMNNINCSSAVQQSGLHDVTDHVVSNYRYLTCWLSLLC